MTDPVTGPGMPRRTYFMEMEELKMYIHKTVQQIACLYG